MYLHMEKFRLFLFVFIASLLFFTKVKAQDSTAVEERKPFRKSSFIPIPIIFYTPETRFGAGVAMLYAFRFGGQSDSQRPSQFQLGFAYTQEKQILAYLPFQIFSTDEKYNIYGELGYYRYIYQVFGVGNETKEIAKEPYTAQFPRVRLNILRLIKPKLYAGIRYWFDDYQINEFQNGGLIAEEILNGSRGGIISGLGPVLTFDSRDNIFFPSSGYLAELEIFRNAPALGSDFKFTRISLDATKYFSIKKDKIFATNLYLVHNSGEPPFQQLAFIGGTKKMRGFFEGRFRDRNLWMLQAEYRAPLFWRMGWVAFAGFGSVSRNMEELFSQKIHSTFGAGLRIRLTNEDPINMRFDLGINGKGGVFPYLTVTEAF